MADYGAPGHDGDPARMARPRPVQAAAEARDETRGHTEAEHLD
ncbi:hypothetical protein ACGRHY_29340 [Streptomyces sp. HK10]